MKGRPNAKQTDWGCFVMKMSREELIAYLRKKCEERGGNSERKYLLSFAEELPDGEYLLAGFETLSTEC